MGTLGERIKALREKKEMSQIELGKLASVGNTTVSQWESNKRTPDTATITKLADIFGVTSDYLLGRTNDPSPRELPDTVAPYLPEGFDELSPEARKEVLDFIDYIMVKYAKEEDKKKD